MNEKLITLVRKSQRKRKHLPQKYTRNPFLKQFGVDTQTERENNLKTFADTLVMILIHCRIRAHYH